MNEKKICFRFADETDCKKLFDWRNDPEVRAVSGDSSMLDFESHKNWFSGVLNDSKTIIFIILNERYKEIGQIRLNKKTKENVISISLDKEFREKGYGALAIKKASEIFLKYFNINDIFAYIKKDNIASVKSFEKAGYVFSHEKENFNVYVYKK